MSNRSAITKPAHVTHSPPRHSRGFSANLVAGRRVGRVPLVAIFALLGALAAGCTSAENRAAKERIFSPEEPQLHLILAEEEIDVSRIADDEAVWDRVLGMGRFEALVRLGAHRAGGEVRFTWSRGDKRVSLVEEYEFEIDDNGDFHTRIMNDEDAGLEFVWADSQAFAKGRYGRFRPRRIDRAQQDLWRDEGSGAFRNVVDLFDGRLKVRAAGEADYEGRRALRFTPTIGEAPKAKDDGRKLPPPVYGLARIEGEEELQPGPDPDTGRRLEFDARKEPVRVEGEILVDRDTAVVLAAKLDAQFRVPGETDDTPAELHLALDWKVTPDSTVSVSPPEGAEPSHTVHAVDDPLWFLDGETAFQKPGGDEEDAD